MGAGVRFVGLVLLLALSAQAAARSVPVHTVLLTPSTPSPFCLAACDGGALTLTLNAGRPAARVVQSSEDTPCAALPRGGFPRALDVGHPSSHDDSGVCSYIDCECHTGDGRRGERRLARRKELGSAQQWGIVFGIVFGVVALVGIACCSWCCCLRHRSRARQARLHVRDEGVQTAAALELPLYERRVRDGEVQLEEAPAPDYPLAEVDGPRAPAEVPLPPSPTETQHPETPTLSSDAQHSPSSMPTPQPDTPDAPRPLPQDDLPPAYSHATP